MSLILCVAGKIGDAEIRLDTEDEAVHLPIVAGLEAGKDPVRVDFVGKGNVFVILFVTIELAAEGGITIADVGTEIEAGPVKDGGQ